MLPNDWPRFCTTDETLQMGSDCQHRLHAVKADFLQPNHCWKAAQLMAETKLKSGHLTIEPGPLGTFTMALRLKR